MGFQGKTVVITGAASGIGRATAQRFAKEGAIVVAADIDGDGGGALMADTPGDIRFQRTDVTKVEDIAAMVALLLSEDGRWITGQVLAVDGGQSLPA